MSSQQVLEFTDLEPAPTLLEVKNPRYPSGVIL